MGAYVCVCVRVHVCVAYVHMNVCVSMPNGVISVCVCVFNA